MNALQSQNSLPMQRSDAAIRFAPAHGRVQSSTRRGGHLGGWSSGGQPLGGGGCGAPGPGQVFKLMLKDDMIRMGSSTKSLIAR